MIVTSQIFIELVNVAGWNWHHQTGDELLNMQSAGVYSQMKRLYTLSTKGMAAPKPSGSTWNFEDNPARFALVIIKLLINRKPSKVDDGDGNLYFNVKTAR
uniref:hypothetical protein n=1 Tax=Salmonella sp. TaxID=599 RepID=UPI001CD9DE47|nr:hypothetical protein [Salmonella sp.]